jgi:AmmeMemoRadiSam system protein B
MRCPDWLPSVPDWPAACCWFDLMTSFATRPPAVAGMFYPGAQAGLCAEVDALLAAAPPLVMAQPKAIIAPHAGYIYSGPTAARIYSALAPWRQRIRRVVLLGPTHRVAVHGLALPTVSSFATPLGNVPLDTAAMAQLDELPQVRRNDAAHALEHSLEVHLPFLQRALDDFTLVPLAVGQAEPEAVAEVLDHLWGGDETLIVISSDLSHFLPYATAQQVDSNTCRHILQLDTHIHPEQACGAYPINGLLLAARRRGLQAALVDLCNSGDTAGDRERVVGYAAFAFHPSDHG